MRSLINNLDRLQSEMFEEGGGDGDIRNAEDRAVDGSRFVVGAEKSPRLPSAAMAVKPGIQIRPAGDHPALRHPYPHPHGKAAGELFGESVSVCRAHRVSENDLRTTCQPRSGHDGQDGADCKA